MTRKTIIGAGLAGLIAACHFKDATIFEAGQQQMQHKALLRFRDKGVSTLTEIPFKEVRVHKEIHFQHAQHKTCSIAMANQYAIKVSNSLRGRSIWNLDSVNRYIAPDTFYEQLVNRSMYRIHWNTAMKPGDIVRENPDDQYINTAPLPSIMEVCGLESETFGFDKKSITVDRCELPIDSDVYQTIYFPELDLRTIRASITGKTLIIERQTGKQPDQFFCWRLGMREELQLVLRKFGIDYLECDIPPGETVEQKYGKIVDLPRDKRESILYELTRDFGVFSLGRFATWRNILLDDVVDDIAVVDRLMNASAYGRGLVLAGK